MYSPKITIIGAGNIGGVFVRHLASKHSLVVCDRGSGRGKALAEEVGAQYIQDVKNAATSADMIILAVKPKDFKELIFSMGDVRASYMVSLLTGIELSSLEKGFPFTTHVRLMPNTACAVGEGILGLAANNPSSEVKNFIESIFSCMGEVFWIEENKMDAFAAIAASSPAFIFLFIESMMNAGVEIGFSLEESKKIVWKVLKGSSALLEKLNKNPQELKEQISSPGGMTIEGLKVLEDLGLRRAVTQAMKASYEKSIQITRELR